MIKAKNGELTFPLRTEYQNRRVYEEAVSGFFTLEKYREMYDDPLKYFLDETRSTDLVSLIILQHLMQHIIVHSEILTLFNSFFFIF